MRLVYKKSAAAVLIVSVSTKKNRKTSGKRAKYYTFVYFYDKNNKFNRRRINKIEAIYYKLRQKKKVRFTCPICKRVFGSYGQKKKDIKCPYCE